MYKKKHYNMETRMFPIISSNSSQNPHLPLKWSWHNDSQSWLEYWGLKEEIMLENKDNIKNTITSKLKNKLWNDKELEGKRKLSIINPTLANHNYLFVFTNVKKK